MNLNYTEISQRIKILAHPERLRLLDLLRRQPECVCHLELILGKSQPYVSQQLRILREAGFIVATRCGNNLYYRLVDAEIGQWLTQILGIAITQHPDIAYQKQIISCECPCCDAGIEVSFYEDGVTSEVHRARPKLIFICMGNSARSQMAEAYLRYYGGDRFEPYSAGLNPQGINPYTVRVMEEIGLSISDHASNGIEEYLGQIHFGYVITVCDYAEKKCPRSWLTGSNHLHWSFDDLAAFEGDEATKLEKFRQVRNQIGQKVLSWLEETG